MEITLVRHVEPNIANGICYGQLDVLLVDNYREQHQIIIQQLEKNDFDIVYSSPLTRCILLAEAFSKEFVVDERISELNFGDWEGKAWDQINETELNFWMQNYITAPAPNGESLLDLVKRVTLFFDDLKKQNLKFVLLISHAGVIKALYNIINKVPLEEVMMLDVTYGQVVKFNL